MCLAIVKPGKLVIPEAHLKEGWQRNSDGAGFAYIRDGKVQIHKGYMSLKDFMAAYDAHFNANKDSNFLIHFRIRTYGAKTPANTHPFPIKGGALIHNGSMSGLTYDANAADSDTLLFARKYADVLSYDTVSRHKKDFEEAIGFNKIAMLYDDGKYLILNEGGGDWENDIWYSNPSYRPWTSMYSRQAHSRWGSSNSNVMIGVGASGTYLGD